MPREVQPPGDYWGALSEIGTDKNKNGTPYMYFQFNITHKQAENSESVQVDKPFQREIRWYLTTAAWEGTEEKLKQIGFNGDFINPGIGDQFKICWLQCEHNKGNDGKTYENWEFNDVESVARERAPVAHNELKKMSARYKNAQSVAKPPAGKPPKTKISKDNPQVESSDPESSRMPDMVSPEGIPQGPPPNDDDIPY